MPKKISEKEQLAVLHAVTRFPASASIDEIGKALDHAVPRRTLQRRIALLVIENRLIPESEGRGRRYRLPPPARVAVTPKHVTGGIRYERSCARYSAVRQSLGEPDPFRLRYRQELADMVAAVVRGRLDKKAAGSLIQRLAFEKAKGSDRSRLIEVTETELMALHEGNIARYRLRPSEYQAWHAIWH